MEWQIKTIARKSSLSETLFKPGDRIICLVYQAEGEGELGRADLLEAELVDFEIPGEVLGRWSRVVKDPEDLSQHAREVMASAEDLFFSLFEHEQSDAPEASNMLKHLLALMLERKRVLRAQPPRRSEGSQPYLHVKTKQELLVPVVEISTELMFKIQDTIGDLLL
ncbi:MAG: hypothetical protein ACI81V_000962 [Lentimonas sp.]|jgi:hypothetical protein